MHDVLEVTDLSKTFGRRRVLDGVSLRVRAGELVALVGENGAGKSTIVQCIAGSVAPDAGEVRIAGAVEESGLRRLAVVWQDLALCDNLDVVENLFLGRELGTVVLSESEMQLRARRLFDELGIEIDGLRRPVAMLSGGERQLVAIARALLTEPAVLVLDEPTAALGVNETRTVERLLAGLRDRGKALLLISHRIEQVFDLADRVVVLRHGRVVADVATPEVHPDDVIGWMSGIEVDTTARRQLRQLRSLVDQLAEVEPAASLPLIVSAMVAALDIEQLCLHLVRDPDATPDARTLDLQAAVGVHESLLRRNGSLPLGEDGGLVGIAAATGNVVVTEDVRHHPAWRSFRNAASSAGVLSAWAVPITGSNGVLGVISAYANSVGRPTREQLELMSLYTNLATAAIERESLLREVTRRNRVLEALRSMLETLAGPDHVSDGLAGPLRALCRGLTADAVALFDISHDTATARVAATDAGASIDPRQAEALRNAALELATSRSRVDRARVVSDHVIAVPLEIPAGRIALTAWWHAADAITNDALDLLDDAARSLRLAIEREEVEAAQKEADTLRRSNSLQRDFLSRLSHELRTPLTAIQGYASTLRQTDVSWDDVTQARFLEVIANESARMGRLVADLLDTSTLETGGLRLQAHWCDLGLVIQAAVSVVPGAARAVTVDLDDATPQIWADHDRLEQVFVNLIDNALRHGAVDGDVRIRITARPEGDRVHLVVRDDGDGVSDELRDQIFRPYVRGDTAGPGAGLGLAITRGIVDAHRGTIWIDDDPAQRGTAFHLVVPIEPPDAPTGEDLHGER